MLHNEHVNAWKLARAKAWLKGETVLRKESRYALDHPVRRGTAFPRAPRTPSEFWDIAQALAL